MTVLAAPTKAKSSGEMRNASEPPAGSAGLRTQRRPIDRAAALNGARLAAVPCRPGGGQLGQRGWPRRARQAPEVERQAVAATTEGDGVDQEQGAALRLLHQPAQVPPMIPSTRSCTPANRAVA